MSELTLHLDWRVRFLPRHVRWGLTALFLGVLAGDLASENVTLNTYYPAPSGVYAQMITTGNTYLARDGGSVGVGTAAPNFKLDVSGTLHASSNAQFDSNLTVGQQMTVGGQVTILGGNPGQGKVLTSNASGVASWQAMPGDVVACLGGCGGNYPTVVGGIALYNWAKSDGSYYLAYGTNCSPPMAWTSWMPGGANQNNGGRNNQALYFCSDQPNTH